VHWKTQNPSCLIVMGLFQEGTSLLFLPIPTTCILLTGLRVIVHNDDSNFMCSCFNLCIVNVIGEMLDKRVNKSSLVSCRMSITIRTCFIEMHASFGETL